MYIYQVSILVDGPENLPFEADLEDHIQAYLDSKNAGIVSSTSKEVTGENYGRCTNCGAWVSDQTKADRILNFSNGARISGKWYCDLCLPPEHPNHF